MYGYVSTFENVLIKLLTFLSVFLFTYKDAAIGDAIDVPNASITVPLYLVTTVSPCATISNPGPLLVDFANIVYVKGDLIFEVDAKAPTPITPETHDGNPTLSNKPSLPVAAKTGID